ncbi:Glycosyltransferase family 10 (fucosyltransferase) C-term [Salinimicrobium sediminis]|uniref:Glycosyltransferase family 10 (Fucosyltransferase) C-term n=1 Tax=Salinimicrobium sediminis TaxID=1343891 RepID=A0A285X4R8_9FLAO|nr:glycosyltransferase family 10 [Salinimicrobium sediminis]SOC80347.1 Glycosyltransferase family 10 (fucosyltransferase) C-term [Salinimicrobium sediminis]
MEKKKDTFKPLKIWFTDFYKGFDPANNYLYELLSRHYELILDKGNPEYLIYSCYGRDFLKYKNPVKIYYTGENLIPDFNLCDYGIGFSYLEFGDRYLRYPNFALIPDQFKKLLKPRSFNIKDLEKKEYFCNFIYSNSQADLARDEFFHLLSNYKKVMSPGSHLKNASMDVGGRFTENWMYTKLNFQSKCKFTIAFENSSSAGYTTEKLMHAYITNTIPIYWGNPEVTKDFNSKSLINCHEFKTFKEVIERVKEIDQNDELALQMLNEPPLPRNEIPENLKEETLERFLKTVFDQDLEKAYRRPKFGTIRNYENELAKKFHSGKPDKLSSLKRLLKL